MGFQRKTPSFVSNRQRDSLIGAGLVLVTALVFPAGCESESESRNKTPVGGEDTLAIRTIVTSEEQILALTAGLASLGKGLLYLPLLDAPRRELFAPTFDVVDLEGSREAGWQPSSKGASRMAIRDGSSPMSTSQPWHAGKRITGAGSWPS